MTSEKNIPQTTISAITCVVIIFISFYMVYSPTVFTPYFILDDSIMYFEKYSLPFSQWRDNDGLLANIRGGRPFLAIGLSVVSRLLHRSFNDDHFFIILRFLNLLLITLTCSMFTIWLVKHLKQCLLAPFISLLIFFLPGYQIIVGQASPIVTVWSFPLVMGALWLMGLKEPLFQEWRDFLSLKRWGRMALPVLLLVISLFTYQLYPLLFLNAAFCIIIFGKYSRSTHRVIVFSHLVVFFLALVLYFLLFKLMLYIVTTHHPPFVNILGREDQFHVTLAHILTNLKGMFSGLFIRRLSNLWVVSMNFTFAKCIGLFIGTVFCASLFQFGLRHWRNRTHRFDSALIYDMMLCFCVFIGINIVNIRLIPNYSFRSLAPSSAFLIILLVWQISIFVGFLGNRYQSKFLFGILAGLTFVFGAFAQYNTYQYFALQSTKEIFFFETQVMPFIQGAVNEVKVIRPKGNSFLPIGDEHSRFNSGEHLYPLVGMLKYAYRKNGYPVPFKRLYLLDSVLKGKTIFFKEGSTARIVRFPEGNPLASIAPDKTVWIDMNYLLHKWGTLVSPKYSFISSHESGVNTVNFAFDGQANPASFWEVGPFPVFVDISYEKEFMLSGYSIINVDSKDRMPLSWKLEGLSTNITWYLLDEQNDVPPWKVNEKRTYSISNPVLNQKYRLTFTKGRSAGGMRVYEILFF
jgi:hypothetical protein